MTLPEIAMRVGRIAEQDVHTGGRRRPLDQIERNLADLVAILDADPESPCSNVDGVRAYRLAGGKIAFVYEMPIELGSIEGLARAREGRS